MRFHARMLAHFRTVSDWVTRHGGKATLGLPDFQLEMSVRNRIHRFFPRFVGEYEGRLLHTSDLKPYAVGFIGWLPYEQKVWREAQEKLEFKRALLRHGERTPPSWLDAEAPPHDVLIKPTRGSFGLGQRGPFRRLDTNNESHRLRPGEFYEQFIHGEVLKVWYWNGELICVDLRRPLIVVGDGHRSVETLVRDTFRVYEDARLRRFHAGQSQLAALLAYQDANWDTVLASGKALQVDYLYGSPLYAENYSERKNHNRIEEVREASLGRKMKSCGPIFQSMIPAETRDNTLFAVDAVVDAAGDVWWLEMNCAPTVPPDAYPSILNSLFNV